MDEPPQTHTVLLVEDDSGVARLMERALRREGYRIVTAGSGEEAMDRVRRDRVDLLLLDLRLPDTEGGALIQRMVEAGCSIPFIVITGQGDERVAVDLMKRGALDYLPKDANFIELVPSVVRRGLEQLERGRRLDEAETDWRESEARYRQLVEALPIAVYTCDTDGRITLFNRAAAALWGREPVIGRDRWCEGHRIFDSAGAPLTPGRCFTARAIREGRSVRDEEIIVERPDGGRSLALAYADPCRDASGAVVGAVNMLVDITERKELEREVLEVSSRVQQRIGQDLHDDLGQWLTSAAFLAEALAKTLAKQSSEQAMDAERIAGYVCEAHNRARVLANGLLPAMIGSDGLVGALRELAATVTSMFGIRCLYEGPDAVEEIDPFTALHFYHIAQESSSNAVRHGGAGTVRILVRAGAGEVTMRVLDDGCGVPQPLPKTAGLGLRTMRYRAGIIGAALEIRPRAEGGTETVCTWRYSESEAERRAREDGAKTERRAREDGAKIERRAREDGTETLRRAREDGTETLRRAREDGANVPRGGEAGRQGSG
jgi:PAS domain S-box-containing protein